MTENVVYWALRAGRQPLEGSLEHPGLLYNVMKIECPFRGGPETGPEYGDIARTEADWYKGYTYFHQYSALAYLARKYGSDLLYFGFTLLDTDVAPDLLGPVIAAEEKVHKSRHGPPAPTDGSGE